MRRVVMSLLVPLAAGSCLPDAIPPANLKNLVNPNGETYPVGLFMANYAAAQAAPHLGSVLIQEVLGYNTTLNVENQGSGTVSQYYGLLGCRDYNNPADRGCLQGVTYHHIAFESWSTYPTEWDFIQRNYTSTAPINKGSLGYQGFVGTYIPKAVQERASSTQGLALEFYRNWNTSWNQPWEFFGDIMAVEKSKLQPCKDTIMADDSMIRRFVEVSGDVDGFVIVDDIHYRGRCDDGYWWLSAKCRSNSSNCVPWITAGTGWGVEEAMQKFTAFHMPVAIGVVVSWGDYTQLPLAGNMSFYWWSADPTFLELAPMMVEFPPYNHDEWAGGKMTSHPKGTSVDTIVSYDLASLAPIVEKFADYVNLGLAQMNEILLDQKTTGDSWETVACRWVTSNRATWERWIPEASECSSGWGLYDALLGGFVEQRQNAANKITCEACPPGTFSKEMVDAMGRTHVCTSCGLGTSQASGRATSCTACKAGEYQDALRGAECKRCGLGTYQDEEGQVECKSCPANTNTWELGSTASSDCSATSPTTEGTTTVAATTVAAPTVVEVTLSLTVDDAAAITGNSVIQFAMINSFATTMGVDASQVTLSFQVSRRLDSARRLQTTLLAIFSVTTPSAAAAEQTRASIEAVSLGDTSTAISTAATGAGYTGSLVVFGKAAVAVREETSSGSATTQMAAVGLMLLLAF